MEAVLLGTGCPVAHPRRGGAATLIAHRGTQLLIDCGAGVTRRLIEAGTRGADIEALLITHLHSDHLVDFYQLIVSSWHQGRARPWPVYAPRPVLDHIARIMESWREERELRIAFERRGSTEGLEIVPHEIAGGVRIEIGAIAVTAVEVNHAPVVPALGFVFEVNGQRVTVSGDTARCPALIEAGKNSDLLIHEVFLHRDMADAPGRRPETISNVASYHTLSSEVGAIAAKMNAKALMLTHFVPPDFDGAALLRQVAQSYDGPILIGEDLMRFDIGDRRLSWRALNARLA